MRTMIAIFLYIALYIDVCASIYQTYSSSSTGYFSTFIVSNFGMARGGQINIDYDISSTALSPTTISNSYILLLILNGQQAGNGWYNSIGSSSQSDLATLCTQPSQFRQQLTNAGNITYNISLMHGEVSQYAVALMQCRSIASLSDSIDISVTVSMLNPQPYSSDFSHLPIDEVVVTKVLEGEIIVYFLMILAMMVQYYFSWRWMKSMHLVFIVNLVTQVLFTISQYVGAYYMQVMNFIDRG